MDPTNSVLKVLPSCCVVSFLGSRKITTILFFFFGTPWIQWCEEHCVSGFTTFSPSCDESSIQYGCQIARISSMECKLLPMVRSHVVAQHFLWNQFSSCVSLNGSEVQQLAVRNLTFRESCFVASVPGEVDPISVSEIA